MTSKSNESPSEHQLVDDREIGKGDLQLLLRAKLGRGQLSVLRATTSALLPPGENFACSLFKIHAVVADESQENSPEEELHLVAKMLPRAKEVRRIFDYGLFFEKEIFFYERLAPALQRLARDFAAKDDGDEEEVFDIAPKVYGSRMAGGEVKDEGVVILMENLKMSGYYMLDKREGLDLAHSRLTIKSLARFHALSIACKHHRPDFFRDEVLAHAKVVPFQEQDDTVDVFELLFTMLVKDPRIAEHRERVHKLLNSDIKFQFFTYMAEEPWLSVAHLDFWTNNILYHKDEDGNLDGIKFIDFQNYAYNSPLRDLPYFLCTSTSHEVMTEHFDELLDLYHETFVGVLRKMQCDVEPFRRDKFDAQLKIDASLEFFHSIMAIKFFCAEINQETYDPSQIDQVVIFSEANDLAHEKWYHIVKTYMKHGWM